MKKILFSILLTICCAGILIATPHLFSSSFKTKKVLFRESQINHTFTATNGCTVHIVGTVNYSIVPPRFNSFTGTITLGGGGSCPTGTLTFNSATISDLTVTFNTDDPNYLTDLSWTGPSYATAILEDGNVEKSLIETLKAVFNE